MRKKKTQHKYENTRKTTNSLTNSKHTLNKMIITMIMRISIYNNRKLARAKEIERFGIKDRILQWKVVVINRANYLNPSNGGGNGGDSGGGGKRAS